MQLYYIRHAQSENNVVLDDPAYTAARREDPELTDRGLRQAELLADFLLNGDPKGASRGGVGEPVGFGITHIYTSLMVRSVKTGAIVARKLGLTLNAWVDIHERGGIYTRDPETGEVQLLGGKSRLYFTEHYPELVLPEDFIDAGWWNRQGMEKPEVSFRRAQKVLNALLENHGKGQDRVALISHGGFYNDFLSVVLGLPAGGDFWFSMYNAAVTRIDFHEALVELVYHNRTDFLEAGMLT